MSKRRPSPIAKLGFVLMPCFILAVDVAMIRDACRQVRARNFPVAAGAITHSELKVHRGEDSTTYGVDVRYDFEVADRHYEGTRYRYGQGGESRNSALQIVDSLPIGKHIDVHYNPVDPNDSVLFVGLQSGDLLAALMMTGLNVMILGLSCVGVVWWFPGIGRLIGRPRAIVRGSERLLELDPVPRLLPAAFILGSTSIIVGGSVELSLGENPPMVAVTVAWAVVLGLTIVAFMWRFTYQGKVLAIDELKKTFSVLCENKNTSNVVIPLRSVTDVVVIPTRQAYEVKLAYSHERKSKWPRTLIEVNDPQRAEQIAGWVKKQILQQAL